MIYILKKRTFLITHITLPQMLKGKSQYSSDKSSMYTERVIGQVHKDIVLTRRGHSGSAFNTAVLVRQAKPWKILQAIEHVEEWLESLRRLSHSLN